MDSEKNIKTNYLVNYKIKSKWVWNVLTTTPSELWVRMANLNLSADEILVSDFLTNVLIFSVKDHKVVIPSIDEVGIEQFESMEKLLSLRMN